MSSIPTEDQELERVLVYLRKCEAWIAGPSFGDAHTAGIVAGIRRQLSDRWHRDTTETVEAFIASMHTPGADS